MMVGSSVSGAQGSVRESRDREDVAPARALLRFVARHAGAFYQPIYIFPLARVDGLEAELKEVGDESGAALTTLSGARGRVVSSTSGPLLVLSHHANARAARDAVEKEERGVQIVLWGMEPPETIDERETRLWIESGLAFDLTDYERGLDRQEWSMGPTVARFAQGGGGERRVLFLVGATASLQFVADEAMFRLLAAGVHPVRSVGADSLGEDGEELEGVAGLVVRMPRDGVITSEMGRALGLFRDAGGLLVLVGDRATQRRVTHDAEGVLGGEVLTLVVSDDRRERVARQAVWPDVREMLSGIPPATTEPVRVLSGNVRNLTLGSVLQTLSMERQEGTLYLYAPGHLGRARLARGSIVEAEVLGDVWGEDDLASARDVALREARELLVFERVCKMGQWPGAGFVFVEGGEEVSGPVRVDPVGVAMEVARRQDEGPRRDRRVGGLGRVWHRTDEGGQPPQGDAATVADALDGRRSLFEIMRSTGLLEEELRDAVSTLAERGLAEPGGESVHGPRPLPTRRVAERLIQDGLRPEAMAVLRDARAAGDLGGQGLLLMGALLVERDPQAATAAFRAGVKAIGEPGRLASPSVRRSLLNALLNTLVIEVRGRQASAEAAWKALRQYMKAGLNRDFSTPRHYAVVLEIALRAGDRGAARAAYRRLAEHPEGEALAERFRPLL